jgi:ribosome biogenesis GTPase
MSLNSDFNLRRLERYLSIAWGSMATPVIVLTKSDLCDDLSARLAEISAVSVGTDVIACSGISEDGYQEVVRYVTDGKTVAFIGSSGVGKSTLINRLMGSEVLDTKEIRGDDKGRHTTTHRQLLLLPRGGIVIDTPGMRELQLESGNLSKSFEDIEELAAGCRYRDCSHTTEPGCAVRGAIESGTISEERFENYKKLQKEISYEGLSSRQLEHEKIKRMFGSMGEMKQVMRYAKDKNKDHY